MSLELVKKSHQFVKENFDHSDPKFREALDLLLRLSSECVDLCKQINTMQEWSDKVEVYLEEIGDYLTEPDNAIGKNIGKHIRTGLELGRELQKTITAKKAVMAKLENDPKQKALAEIQKHYDSVKGQFKRRGYSAQFIREMHGKYPVITDQKTIANLVARLNKENDQIPR